MRGRASWTRTSSPAGSSCSTASPRTAPAYSSPACEVNHILRSLDFLPPQGGADRPSPTFLSPGAFLAGIECSHFRSRGSPALSPWPCREWRRAGPTRTWMFHRRGAHVRLQRKLGDGEGSFHRFPRDRQSSAKGVRAGPDGCGGIRSQCLTSLGGVRATPSFHQPAP